MHGFDESDDRQIMSMFLIGNRTSKTLLMSLLQNAVEGEGQHCACSWRKETARRVSTADLAAIGFAVAGIYA